MTQCVPLSDLRPGESGVVTALEMEGLMARRLLDLGLVEGSLVTCVGQSPWGDPAAYRICGAVIALRNADSAAVCVRREEAVS